jgi:C4-dicarboxylate transporter, DctM subunit
MLESLTFQPAGKGSGISRIPLSSILTRILSQTERAGAVISGALILIMMVMTTLDVFLRYVLNSPISGNYESQPILLIGVVYLAAASIQAKRSHISLDLITSHLSKRNQFAFLLFSDIIFLAFSAIICWQFALASWTAWVSNDIFWGIVKIPLWPPYLIITVGTGLLSVRLIEGLISNPLWRKGSGISFSARYIRIAITILVVGLITAGMLVSLSAGLQPLTVGFISIGLFVVLLFLGVPVSACMGLVAIIGFWMLKGSSSALGLAANIPFSSVGQYTLTVMPLFILMGSFAALASFAEEGFNLARKWLEVIPGGIIHATVVGATAFAASTGSAAASCAVLAKVAIPEMLKQGVRKGMAIGVVASASTLAMMIPPSTAFVIYAMLTGNSVGKLLIAGIIPGLIAAATIMITVAVRCKLDPLQSSYSAFRTPWKERLMSIPRAWGLLFIALVIVGGLYTGIFTPTEAGSIGAFAGLLAVFIMRKAKYSSISQLLFECGGLTSQIMFILLGGMMFSSLMSITRLPAMLSTWILSIDVAPILVIVIIMVMYVLLGCCLDDLSIMVATLPIIYPIVIQLGFNPIWFGVLMVMQIEIGVVTPPYGMSLFVLRGILPNTSMGEIYRGVMWFVVPMLLSLLIYLIFPQVATWLPSMMK